MTEGRQIQVQFEFRLAPGGEEFNSQAVAPHLQQILQYAAGFIRLEQGAVERIVIADAPVFGEIVYEFQDKAGRTRGYSDRGYFTAVTKNIPRELEDGSVTSTIIIHSGVIGPLIEMIEQGVPLTEWDINHRHWFYILIQELARSLDHRLRGDISDRGSNIEEEHDELPIARHFVPIVVEQFVVGVYGGASVTPELHRYLVEGWHTSARELINPLLDRKFSFNGVTTLVRDAAVAFWALLSQYANLFGNTISNSELEEIPPWPYAGEEVEPALRKFDQTLRELWDSYPQLPPDDHILEQMLPSWRQILEAHGFGYTEEDDSEEEANE